MLLTTLAVCLAAKAFRETQFVTDSRGAAIGRALGWEFTYECLELDNWPMPGLTHVWALGKLIACAIQVKPFVQFDGDVLLFKPLPGRLRRSAIIAQSPDRPDFYDSAEMHEAMGIAGYPPGITAYNAGLLGGCDVALMRAYAWAGLELSRKFIGTRINGTVISMLVEQYQLGMFSQRTGIEVDTLLPATPTKADVSRAGYAHSIGPWKHTKQWTEKAEWRMENDFPEQYARFLHAWPAVQHL
jgi:hypothetical protein